MVHLVLNDLARRKLAESEKKENVPRDLPLGCAPGLEGPSTILSPHFARRDEHSSRVPRVTR
jgi:hypothetical protein